MLFFVLFSLCKDREFFCFPPDLSVGVWVVLASVVFYYLTLYECRWERKGGEDGDKKRGKGRV